MSLLFKNYSLLEVMYLLIRFNMTKSFLINTKNTERNCIVSTLHIHTHTYTYTHTSHREKSNFRKLLFMDSPSWGNS